MSTAETALIVAITSAGISLAGLAWNLALYRLSGARLSVRLIPAILTAQGHLLRGPDRGWRRPVPDTFTDVERDHFVDLAIIKVTNVGRAAVSVSDITLDFGRSGWRPGSRHTIAGRPVPVHECREVSGDVRLEAGQSVSVAFDYQPLIDNAREHSSSWNRWIHASATAAGRRPTRSAWRRRWRLTAGEDLYYPAPSTPERSAFVEVFRAVYPREVNKVYDAWLSVSGLLLQDANAGGKEVADVLAEVLEIEPIARLDLISASFRIVQLLPHEVTVGGEKRARGTWGTEDEHVSSN